MLEAGAVIAWAWRVVVVAMIVVFAVIAATRALLGDADAAWHAVTVAAAIVLGALGWSADSPRFDSRSMPDGEGWALWRNPPDGRWAWVVWHPSGVWKGDAVDETDARKECWLALSGARTKAPTA